MSESLQLTQEQKLQQRLSAQQVQFVKMLEMSTPELEETVRRVLDENPALIEVDSEPHDSDHRDHEPDGVGDDDVFNETPDQLQAADYSNPDDRPDHYHGASNHSDDDLNPRDLPTADNSESLIDSLMAQLRETDLGDFDRAIAEYIIGNIDNSGYLTRTADDIAYDMALIAGFDPDAAHVQKIIDVVRTFEPAGICARDLRDCLLLQLDRRIEAHRRPSDITARRIIADYFDLFSKMHYDRLCSALGISPKALQDALDSIRDLDPKPGAGVGYGNDDRFSQITPDFRVEPADDKTGTFNISLLNRIPELAIERSFIPTSKLPTNKHQKEAQIFIRSKHEEASIFLSCLKRRSETLYSVMEAIVRLQPEFFNTYDKASLRPMILKDIAAITGHDLSVISRATANKYVSTPAGIFPLKMFFNESAPDKSGASLHKILDSLKTLIDNEDHRHPLSDDALTRLLNQQGYKLARRTVTKYRERLNIPVARLRKQI